MDARDKRGHDEETLSPRLKLQLREPRIEAARRRELRVRALLDDTALIEHQNSVA